MAHHKFAGTKLAKDMETELIYNKMALLNLRVGMKIISNVANTAWMNINVLMQWIILAIRDNDYNWDKY